VCAEFDALTGSKIALVDLGARVVRMAYSPTASHVIIAILEVCFDAPVFRRSCFIHLEQRIFLYHLLDRKTGCAFNTMGRKVAIIIYNVQSYS
jgi:hypothetical protein